VAELAREADDARLDRGLSFRALGRAIGISGEQAARICRGQSPDVSVVRLAEVLEVVGLELGARAYAGSTPFRDRGQRSLLARFRARLSPVVRWRLEEPVVAIAGTPDRRAWDAWIGGDGWAVGVEAETHVRDTQALTRRVNVKQRDGGVDSVVLLLTDSRWHRELVRDAGDLREVFPVPARAALRELSRGSPPGGNAIVVL
jgi:transcriptional regulator with XRE-family HTH domain